MTRGIEPPEKFDEPEISPGTEFFLQATVHLLSCRGVGMDLGPVPWTAVYAYCEAVDFADWERMFNIVNIVDSNLREEHKEKK